jgi:hypothetical protein
MAGVLEVCVMDSPTSPLPDPRPHPMQVPDRHMKGISTPAASAASRISSSGPHLGAHGGVARAGRGWGGWDRGRF